MNRYLWVFLSLLLLGASGPTKSPLVVYTYDSLVGKGTLGEYLAAEFKKREGVEIKWVVSSNAGESLNQIILEGKGTRADVVLGVESAALDRVQKAKLFSRAPDALIDVVPRELRFDSEQKVVPFDYGWLAFVYDASRTQIPPGFSLERLCVDPIFKKKIVIEDPRSSSLGLSFLAWTHANLDEAKVEQFWRTFSTQLITITPGWSSAYGMFLNKEAELVLSYTTSPAYHLVKDPKSPIRAIAFEEGNFRQIEGAAVLESSTQKEMAFKFLSFLLSPDAQAQIPQTQWMYPVRDGVPLPLAYSSLPKVKKSITMEPSRLELNKQLWLKDWARWVSGIKSK